MYAGSPWVDLDAIEAEADAILAWAIEGARLWAEHGLQEPAAVREYLTTMRRKLAGRPVDELLRRGLLPEPAEEMSQLDPAVRDEVHESLVRKFNILPVRLTDATLEVATANPFNQQAAKELAETTANRLIWYLVPPSELVNTIRKAFR